MEKGISKMTRNRKSISRRDFVKASVGGALLASASTTNISHAQIKAPPLYLGGPVQAQDPENWVRTHKKLGYSAAYCPVGADAKDDIVKAYADAAKKADIVIAEVGAWSNPISPDEKERRKALAFCCEQLALADRIGAVCCVNISGSRGEQWDGPDKNNLTSETFDMIVEVIRKIIDNVKPKRTYFTLEPMPWAYPDSADSYLRLIKAIDRKRFAAHLDPVNIINSPQRYFNNAELIRDCFSKLGPYIKSCHAKDIILEKELTTHLNEIRPGLGGLDYAVFLSELSKLPGTPLMLEHLQTQEQYLQAANYVRSVAKKIGLSFA
jgi:sugar phosphate isomerase/epimerase